MPPRTILILGGTAEAARLADRLAAREDLRVITALAGRTRARANLAGEVRVGGFGGADGLAAFLERERVDCVVDATHPFATRISANAGRAAARIGVRRLAFVRAAWTPQPGDAWHAVESGEAAATALPAGARVFLALGSQHLAPFAARTDCFLLVRMIDPPAAPLPLGPHTLVAARPGADAAAEARLLCEHAITHVVCRNSGGDGARAKLDAAHQLGLPVVMIARPPAPVGTAFHDFDALLAAIG